LGDLRSDPTDTNTFSFQITLQLKRPFKL
jgi:hypothetical protein